MGDDPHRPDPQPEEFEAREGIWASILGRLVTQASLGRLTLLRRLRGIFHTDINGDRWPSCNVAGQVPVSLDGGTGATVGVTFGRNVAVLTLRANVVAADGAPVVDAPVALVGRGEVYAVVTVTTTPAYAGGANIRASIYTADGGVGGDHQVGQWTDIAPGAGAQYIQRVMRLALGAAGTEVAINPPAVALLAAGPALTGGPLGVEVGGASNVSAWAAPAGVITIQIDLVEV